ncbi:hypothetical protein PUN28_020524 [Cardiocondyla obscurior]|uniref:Uncharacterized protein n=1 Tax=Cardiocondyla obscurior TaxID=286306 RepID=A0AAW2E567_9HYME
MSLVACSTTPVRSRGLAARTSNVLSAQVLRVLATKCPNLSVRKPVYFARSDRNDLVFFRLRVPFRAVLSGRHMTSRVSANQLTARSGNKLRDLVLLSAVAEDRFMSETYVLPTDVTTGRGATQVASYLLTIYHHQTRSMSIHYKPHVVAFQTGYFRARSTRQNAQASRISAPTELLRAGLATKVRHRVCAGSGAPAPGSI